MQHLAAVLEHFQDNKETPWLPCFCFVRPGHRVQEQEKLLLPPLKKSSTQSTDIYFRFLTTQGLT